MNAPAPGAVVEAAELKAPADGRPLGERLAAAALRAAWAPVRRTEVWQDPRPALGRIRAGGGRWPRAAAVVAAAAYLAYAPAVPIGRHHMADLDRPALGEAWEAHPGRGMRAYLACVAGPALYAAWIAQSPARVLTAAVVAAVFAL